MKKDSRSKMQRRAASKRKSWTNKQRFENKEKNRLRLAPAKAAKKAQELLQEAENEIVNNPRLKP